MYNKTSSMFRVPGPAHAQFKLPTCLWALALALLVCACGGSGSSSPENNSSADSRASDRYTCGKSSGCTPSLGVLKVRDGDESGRCTATLVSEDIAATASHCLPEAFRSGDRCAGHVSVHFAEIGNYREAEIGCRRVLYASPLFDRTRGQSDVAFLKLSQPANRPFMKISHAGIDANSLYTALKVQPMLRNDSGNPTEILSEACRPIFGSEILPGSSERDHPVIAFGDCKLERINDGAPLIDAQGLIRGFLQGPMPFSRITRKINSRKIIDLPVSPMALATNLACVRMPEKDGDFVPSDNCSTDPNERSEPVRRRLNEMLASQISQIVPIGSYFRSRIAAPLQWATRAFSVDSEEGKTVFQILDEPISPYSFVAIPVPQCFSQAESEYSPSLEIPVLGFRNALDRYLVIHPDLGSSVGTLTARIQIEAMNSSPAVSPEEPRKVASVFIQTSFRSWARIYRAEIPACGR